MNRYSYGSDFGRSRTRPFCICAEWNDEAPASASAKRDRLRRLVFRVDQQPTKEQLAKLFDVMRIREQMQSMRQIVPGMVAQQIQAAMKQTEASLPAGTKLTQEQREGMQKVMSKYVGKAMDLYPTDEMLADMTTIYQQHLSKDDVDGLITFYSSSAGHICWMRSL